MTTIAGQVDADGRVWMAGDTSTQVNDNMLQATLDQLERDDPAVEAAARSYNQMVEKLTGRTFCPICGGLGWYDDDQGRAECSCQAGR